MASWKQGEPATGQSNDWSGSNDNPHAGHIETDGADNTENDNQAPTGVLSSEEDAAFRSKAQEAGWTETVPVNYTRQSACDEEYQTAVYEWNDEYGDVGPAIPELEQQLYGGEFRLRQGDHMQALKLDVTVEGPERILPIRSFDQAGMHPVMQEIVTQKMGYLTPTSIQAWTIPAVLCGEGDVIAISQTGSGKTAAYLIPIISRLLGKVRALQAPRPNTFAPGYNERTHRVKAEPLVVVIVPTRELAKQVFDECCRLCYRSMLRPFATYGGQPMPITFRELGRGVDLLIGTPGRLCDVMDKPDVLSMSRVLYTVIDEADEMLHSDWEEEMGKILGGGDTNENADHAFMMFSATFPKELRQLARQYMTPEHYRLSVGRPGSAHKNVKQDVVLVVGSMKMQACFDLLYAGEPKKTLIFCNSKRTVDELDAFLYQRRLPTTSIHSDRSQREREDNMRAFITGRAPIMIATGVSARGLDVPGIHHIINFDLPSMMFGGIDEYVHRIGRTARIGHTGMATSFYNPDRDEEIGQPLVNVLAECECQIPDFLEHLEPEKIDDGTDDEKDEAAQAEQSAGQFSIGDETNNNASGFVADSTWGGPAGASDDANGNGDDFTPDNDNAGSTDQAW